MQYRIGVIGCGGQGRRHAPEWQQLENCEVVALCDPVPEMLNSLGEQFPNAARYPTHREMIDAGGLDIVSITTWPDAHAEPTILAAERGMHVFCEKPMTLDLQECDAMIEACRKNGVTLVISHNRRNDPRYDKAVSLVADGVIGRLCRVHAADKGYEAGYGMMNIGTHIFDSLRMMFGEVRSVFGHLTVDGRDVGPQDIITEGNRGTGYVAGKEGTVILAFECGIDAVVEWDPEANRFGMEIIGDTGRLAFMNPGQDLWHLPTPAIQADNFDQWRKVELTPEENPYDYPARSTRERMLQEMLQWIEGGPVHCSDGAVGRAAIELIMAVYWSHRKRGWVDLPLLDTRHPLKVWRHEAGLE